MFGKLSYTATVRSALAQMLADEEVLTSVGAAKFTRKDKKTVGYIYLRNGKVYAAASNNYVPNIMTRLVQAGHLSEESISKITRHFGEGNENDPKLAEFVIDRHMVPEKVMATIQQDFFLEVFAEILSWEDVAADWRYAEVTEFYKIDRFEVQKVIDLVDTRQTFLNQVAEDFEVPVTDLDKIVFKAVEIPELDEETVLIFHQLFSIADGLHDIRSATNLYGLTLFRTIQSIHDLWHEGYVELTYENKLIASYVDPSIIETVEENPIDEKETTVVTAEKYTDDNNRPFAGTVEIGEGVEIDLEDDTDAPLLASNHEVTETSNIPVLIVEEIEITVDEVPVVEVDVVEEETSTVENDNTEAPIERLIKELSHEVDLLRVKIQTVQSDITDKETQQAILENEIVEKKTELSTMEKQYTQIVSKLDKIR